MKLSSKIKVDWSAQDEIGAKTRGRGLSKHYSSSLIPNSHCSVAVVRWSARNLPSQVNESKGLAICIHHLVFVGALVSLTRESNQDIHFLGCMVGSNVIIESSSSSMTKKSGDLNRGIPTAGLCENKKRKKKKPRR
eukprot:TRINITY_DN12821_c0_g1_i1.p1 TRINITY_DN12821_c0_g1~~TRINITY_DN12821_c0_g1_i1.p1  ORF type:complete len:136 (+),score=17.57 TRINITY_DN12821_c0_g1_i1:155-562(+)